jgi:hypothetical protein
MLSPTEKCPFRFLNEIFDPFYGLVVRIPKLGLTASDSGHEVARKRSMLMHQHMHRHVGERKNSNFAFIFTSCRFRQWILANRAVRCSRDDMQLRPYRATLGGRNAT